LLSSKPFVHDKEGFLMPFDSSSLLLLCFIALGSYVQGVTGFAFGLIVMGSVTALNLASIEVTAFIVSILSLINSLTGLYGGHYRAINTRALLWIIIPCLPAMFVGIWLLNYLGESQWGLLKIILGTSIIFSSITMLYQVKNITRPSPRTSLALSGIAAGIMGGMFATFGPPITYIMYRQPTTIIIIRATLLCAFSITAFVRIIAVSSTQVLTNDIFWLCIVSIPIVVLTSTAARVYKLPFSSLTIKRCSFGLLLLSGISLIIGGLNHYQI